MDHIEKSSEKGRFTLAEIRSQVKESKTFWASPAGRKRSAEMEAEKRLRKTPGVKFPDIAKRGTTKPILIEHPSITIARARLPKF